MPASIGTGLTQNESCVFKEHKVYFYKPTEPTVQRQECVKDDGVMVLTRNHLLVVQVPVYTFLILDKRFFIMLHYGTNSKHQLNNVQINLNGAFELEIKP